MKLKNLERKILRVSHARLQRLNKNDSVFKSRCPACPKGILLVRRHQETFDIINIDACVACGQRVVYTDRFIAGHQVVDVLAEKN